MWSRKYEKCIKCGTTERKHQAFGLCTRCYTNSPAQKQRNKKYLEKYLKKVLGTTKYKQGQVKAQQKFQKTKRGMAVKKKVLLKRKYKRFLKRKKYSTELNNIRIRIDGVEYLTPFKPTTIKESRKLSKQLAIFKEIIYENNK